MGIEQNAYRVLSALFEAPRDQWVGNEELAEQTGLEAGDLNDAVSILDDAGLIEPLKVLGTAPYEFLQAMITSRGRYEYERSTAGAAANAVEPQPSSDALNPPVPVGSPYGFQDEDWELVSTRKADATNLNVVLGMQFTSTLYDTDILKTNVEAMFGVAVEQYNRTPGNQQVQLVFRALSAGYGEHLFNEIARDIIAADIAVFETSDMNPNVMLEMGVALTWGVRVLPIKLKGQDKPPSDVSGQTWADYIDNAATFVDLEHPQKLLAMVQRAVRKKARRA